MWMLLAAAAAGLLVFAADTGLLLKKRTAGSVIHALFRDMIVSNLTALFLAQFVLRIENVFLPSLHGPWYPLKYFALALGTGILLLFCKGVADGVLSYTSAAPKRRARTWVLRIVCVFLFALGTAAFTGTIWSQNTFGELTPDQMLINLISPVEGTASDVMNTLFFGPVFQTVFLTTVFCLFAFSDRILLYHRAENKTTVLFPALARKIVSLVLALAVLCGGIAFGVRELQLGDLYTAYMDESPYIEEHFADPREVHMTFPVQKRNLIHIYLESVENTYFSKELGGLMDENLMPELSELAKEGYSFSDRSEGFGGPPWTTGGHWSVASMVNMGTGLPMKVPVDGNSYGSPNNFLPGAVAIGDILQEQGYEQAVMFGADANFGGLSYYFASHGNFEILDYNKMKELGKIPEDYYVWWGYEDSKLFEFAKEELTKLSETGKPFHFVMETANTHFPDGYLEPDAPTPYESQYANVIAYSSYQTEQFVRWIQQQPFYENTTIVLIGDHLSMDQNFFKDLDPNYRRTTFNLILNPAPNVRDIPEDRLHNRQWANFDMFPTLLSSIGVEIEGDRLGLGTDLFSGTPTRFEEDGTAEVNEILRQRSNFYNNNILLG